ncbi:hypothetical protein BDW62DRAFT_56787 [Aspergillus aurantiobrunneus]
MASAMQDADGRPHNIIIRATQKSLNAALLKGLIHAANRVIIDTGGDGVLPGGLFSLVLCSHLIAIGRSPDSLAKSPSIHLLRVQDPRRRCERTEPRLIAEDRTEKQVEGTFAQGSLPSRYRLSLCIKCQMAYAVVRVDLGSVEHQLLALPIVENRLITWMEGPRVIHRRLPHVLTLTRRRRS